MRLLVAAVLLLAAPAALAGKAEPPPARPEAAAAPAPAASPSPAAAVPAHVESPSPAATPVASPEPVASARAGKIKVAVLDLIPNGTSPELAASLTSVIASELEHLEVFSIISRQEIRAMLSHEAEKQALGCDAGSSCLADIGGALGVRYLVSGNVGRIGDAYTLNLALSDVEKATVEGRVTENVKEQGKLLDVAARSSKVLVAKILSDRQATLIVTCPERGATVKIDGQAIGVTPLPRRKIGWGPHLLEIEKTGFVSSIEDFTVQTKGFIERQVTMIPSPDFLQGYEGSASKMRLGAWLTTGAATLAVVGAGYFQFAYNRTADDFKTSLDRYNALANKRQEDFAPLQTKKTQAEGQLGNARILSGLGLAFAVGATYFWIAGEDPDRYARYRELSQTGRDDDAGRSLLSRVSFDAFSPAGVVSASLDLP